MNKHNIHNLNHTLTPLQGQRLKEWLQGALAVLIATASIYIGLYYSIVHIPVTDHPNHQDHPDTTNHPDDQYGNCQWTPTRMVCDEDITQ